MSGISDINARLRQILKMIATIGFLVASECTKFVSAPEPAGGELTALLRTPSLFKGDTTSKGKGRGGEIP